MLENLYLKWLNHNKKMKNTSHRLKCVLGVGVKLEGILADENLSWVFGKWDNAKRRRAQTPDPFK